MTPQLVSAIIAFVAFCAGFAVGGSWVALSFDKLARDAEAERLWSGAEGVGVHAHRMSENGAHHHVR